MSLSLPDTALTGRVERTYVMQFNTPINAEYNLTIHRECIGTTSDGTKVREWTKKAYCEPVSKLMTRPSTDAFYAACLAAPSKAHLIGVIASWCDNLCAEIQAEIAAQVNLPSTPEE